MFNNTIIYLLFCNNVLLYLICLFKINNSNKKQKYAFLRYYISLSICINSASLYPIFENNLSCIFQIQKYLIYFICINTLDFLINLFIHNYIYIKYKYYEIDDEEIEENNDNFDNDSEDDDSSIDFNLCECDEINEKEDEEKLEKKENNDNKEEDNSDSEIDNEEKELYYNMISIVNTFNHD